MARRSRRRRGDDSSLGGSLFPFLSVLACVIGALSLLIAGLSIGEMSASEDDFDWVAWHELTGALADDSAAIETLEMRIADGRVRIAASEGSRELARIEQQIGDLEDQHGDLIEEIRRQKDAVEQARASMPPVQEPHIIVQPSGRRLGGQPFFVECTNDALLVHKIGASWHVPVLKEEMAREFRSFLRGVRSKPGAMVIFLIRPDGVRLYGRAARMADGVGVRHGKLPIPGQGRIDLGLFGTGRESG